MVDEADEVSDEAGVVSVQLSTITSYMESMQLI